jgi:hypothetical protein
MTCPDWECKADLSRNGIVDTDDLLILLATFGRADCSVSLVDDSGGIFGHVNTADLLHLLSMYGRAC